MRLDAVRTQNGQTAVRVTPDNMDDAFNVGAAYGTIRAAGGEANMESESRHVMWFAVNPRPETLPAGGAAVEGPPRDTSPQIQIKK